MSSVESVSAGPSLLLVEAGLAFITFAVAFCCPRAGSRWFSLTERVFARIARRRRLSVLFVGLSALLLRLLILPLSPIPQPVIHDDFSYLLAADTFSSGRLANPTHPMWTHFESFHIDMKPTYMSMYFPAQGIVLAAGKVLFGHPWYGVLISAALMCAAICWMLQGWLPPGWALFGGMLAVLRLGLFSYWVDTYTGGAVAAIGGALVLGALPRLRHAFRTRDLFWMALGMAILANSRPYEGLLISMPTLGVLSWWLAKFHRKKSVTARPRWPGLGRLLQAIDPVSEPRPKEAFTSSEPRQADIAEHHLSGSVLVRRVAPGAALLVVTVALMAYYNLRVFGNIFTPPYAVNRATYASAPHFLWQSPRPEPVYRHKVMREFYSKWELDRFLKQGTVAGFFHESGTKLVLAELFFFGFALLMPLVMLPRVLRDRRVRFLVVASGVLVIGLAGETWLIPHYIAPFAAGLYAILLQCMRHLRACRPRCCSAGLFLVRATPILCLALAGLRLYGHPLHLQFDGYPAFAWYGGTRALAIERPQVVKKLESLERQQLAIVRYTPKHDIFAEWVYNAADIDRSKLVWARDMGQANNLELIRYFKNRTVWLVEPDFDPPSISLYSLNETEADPKNSPSSPESMKDSRDALLASGVRFRDARIKEAFK